MQKKIPLMNRVFAFGLSILFCVLLVPSFFSLPVELVLFNPNTYQPVIEDEVYAAQYPDVVTRLLSAYFYNPEINPQVPAIMSQQSNLEWVIKEHVPQDWAMRMMTDLFNHALNFLNFKNPEAALTINTQDLKAAMIQNSAAIAADYLSLLPSCGSFEEEVAAGDSVYDLSPCKPDAPNFPRASALLSQYIEDTFQRLPNQTSVIGSNSYDLSRSDSLFRTYSIARWFLRLLPIFSLCILIAIALLLRAKREIMFAWIGKLLLIVCGVCLFALVILLIGFDQFIAIMLNPLLRQLIPGFDMLILGVVHRAGYQTIIWVIVSLMITIGFGASLVLMGKYFRPKERMEIPETPTTTADETVEDQVYPQEMGKSIMPETLEEIEQADVKKTRRKKTDEEKD